MKIKIISKSQYLQIKKLKKNFEVSNKNYDICIAIGGDATFMRAAQEFDGPILPIRGEETGSTGYYADVGITDIDFIMHELKNENFEINDMGRKLEIKYKNKKYLAINEARLNNIIENVSFNIYEVNGSKRKLLPYVMSGDGLIITGEIGSTAYNRSAGGPIILSPHILCVTFINPDGPYRNSIVFDEFRKVEVEIAKYEGALRYDNTQIAVLKKGEKFSVGLSQNTIKVIRFKNKQELFSQKLERIIKSKLIEEI